MKELTPEGVIVLIKNSKHLFMEMRGIESKNTHVTISTVRGAFLKEPEIKKEFLKIVD